MHHFLHWLTKGLEALGLTDPALRAPLAVSLGAVPGALSRYYLTLGFNQWLGPDFPYGTFVVNLSGALIMGFFTTLALERVMPPDVRLLVAVGFLGSYTTFSTYALDTANLLQVGSRGASCFYWAGSSFLGVLSLEIGSFLARRLP
jgi:CrcB protein